VDRFIGAGYTVLLETNGSMDISVVNERCIKIVDIKCPSSGESAGNDLGNLKRMVPGDQVKFVIGCREDYAFAKEITLAECAGFPGSHILYSPAYGIQDPAALSGWILKDGLNVRFQVQLHKILWPGAERGR
jgi:7-carboxy-7-deazaguanine synthase